MKRLIKVRKKVKKKNSFFVNKNSIKIIESQIQNINCALFEFMKSSYEKNQEKDWSHSEKLILDIEKEKQNIESERLAINRDLKEKEAQLRKKEIDIDSKLKELTLLKESLEKRYYSFYQF